MRKLLIGLGLVIALVIVGLIAAPFFISVEQFKPQIQAAVEKATGRTLSIDGPISLSMFPPASLTVSQVRFSNMKGAPQPDMASLKEMRLALKVMPLLSGNLVVDEFVLEEPVIALYVDKNGKPNWQLDMAPAESGQTTLPTGLTLGDVRINRGKITYEDAQSGAKHSVSDVDLKVGLDSMTSPLSLEGSGAWDGKPVRMTMSAENFSDLLAKGSGLTLALASDLLKIDYKGTLGLGGGLQAAGQASLDIPSLTALAAAGGAKVEAQKGTLQRFAVSGKVSAAGTKYAFTEAKLVLDKIEGSGGVTIDNGGKIPKLSGRLDIANLDLRPYLPPPAPAASAPGGAPAPAQTEWSDAPIKVAGLDAVSADFDLTVGAIQVAGLEIGRSAVKLLVNNGRLNATLSDFNLYGGRGQGQLSLSGEGGVSLASRFTLEGIQIEPLLAAASNFRKLTGTGRLSYDITARGGSQRTLMRGLNGRVETNLRDGAIKGIDLAAMARNVAGAFLTGDNAPRQTDFAELAGSLTIVNGVGTNNDLRMVNPFVRLSGAGTVDIANKNLKYRIEPRLVASTEGQGAQAPSGGGLGVPIIVEGPWAKLSYKPDLSGAVKNVLSNPKGAVDAVKGVRDAVKGGSPTDALKGLLGR